MKKRKTVSEGLNDTVQAECKGLIDEYNLEKDPEIRLKIQYEILRKVIRTVIIRVSRLKEKDWRRFLKEQIKPLGDWIEKTSREILEQRLRRGQLGLQDIGLLHTESELAEGFGRLSRIESQVLRKKRTIERLLALIFLSYVGLYFQMGVLVVNLEPLSELNTLVAKRFGADHNWTLAAALLSTHENLVKQKLADLGIPHEKIEQISRKEGFASLLTLLAREIEAKEKRRVSLAFYKSSSLRMVRNKLEHEGYRQKVTKEEVFDLLKEIKRFEAELFPK